MSGPYVEAFMPRHPGWAELGIRGWAELGRDLAAEIEGKGKGKGKGTGKGKGKDEKGKYTWEMFLEDEGVLFEQLKRHMETAGPAGAIARTISRVLFVYKGKGKGKGKIIEGADDNDEGGTSYADEGGTSYNDEGGMSYADEGQIEGADDKDEGGTSNDEGGTIIEGADDKKDDEGRSVHPPRATLAEIAAEVSGLTRGERTDGACVQ